MEAYVAVLNAADDFRVRGSTPDLLSGKKRRIKERKKSTGSVGWLDLVHVIKTNLTVKQRQTRQEMYLDAKNRDDESESERSLNVYMLNLINQTWSRPVKAEEMCWGKPGW